MLKVFKFRSAPRSLNFRLIFEPLSQNTRKLHEDLRTHILEQKKEIDLLQTRDADSQKAIAQLETRLKKFEGINSD
jgi:uncharacterized protein involved in exopolysaccharide biosynthesis